MAATRKLAPAISTAVALANSAASRKHDASSSVEANSTSGWTNLESDPPTRLNPDASVAAELLFKSPSRARTSADLAGLAGMTRRSLYRHTATAGLQPRLLIDCARLLRADTLLRNPGSRLKDTSAKLGFASPETLSELLQEWTGHTVRTIHQGVQSEDFVRFLAGRLLRTTHESGGFEEARESITESV